jgi:hypothetical protein
LLNSVACAGLELNEARRAHHTRTHARLTNFSAFSFLFLFVCVPGTREYSSSCTCCIIAPHHFGHEIIRTSVLRTRSFSCCLAAAPRDAAGTPDARRCARTWSPSPASLGAGAWWRRRLAGRRPRRSTWEAGLAQRGVVREHVQPYLRRITACAPSMYPGSRVLEYISSLIDRHAERSDNKFSTKYI